MALPKILLFYVFTPLADPDAVRLWQRDLCESLGLRGRILLAPHGINATVGGDMDACRRYVRKLREYAPFASADVKWSDGSGLTDAPGGSGWRESVDFPKLVVKVRPELVTFGVPDGLEVDADGVVGGGERLTPHDLHALVESRGEEIVFFDGRNAYEAAIGRFDGAVVPDVRTTDEFVAQLDAGRFDDLKDRPVVTYCTGGIRCEVLSALMRDRGFGEVYQLDGGIARYGAAYGDRGLWSGSLYVFDGRGKLNFTPSATVISTCTGCGAPSDRLVTIDDAPAGRNQVVLCADCRPVGDRP